MRARRFVLPIAFLALAGCDRITGGVDQKALDAEAIGYACRISLKAPEDCIKENDTHSPTSILFGWKEAERDIREKAIDPTMGKNQPAPQNEPPAAATEIKPVADKAAGSAAAAKSEKPAATASEKPAATKSENPAATAGEKPAAGKPEQDAAEIKANR